MLQKIQHFPYCSSFQLFQVILSMLGFLFLLTYQEKTTPSNLSMISHFFHTKKPAVAQKT
jgi:hypothetical protein